MHNGSLPMKKYISRYIEVATVVKIQLERDRYSAPRIQDDQDRTSDIINIKCKQIHTYGKIEHLSALTSHKLFTSQRRVVVEFLTYGLL